MKKYFPYILITCLFFGFLIFKHNDIFRYTFDSNLIPEYLRSQDIEDTSDVIKDRVFVSDSQIYTASGYLYAKGEDPTKYNFQHPPFIKYLFGLSIVYFGNPFYVQIFFGLALLLLTYFLGQKVFKNTWISLMGTLLLLLDPVFSNMMGETLLDLGQAVFALGYVILTFFYPGNFILQGIILGLFAGSKFWSTAIIFVALIYAYKMYIKKEKIDFKCLFKSLATALLVFSLTYSVSFIKADWFFNIFVFQGKILKFMLSHNSAGLWGNSIFLFSTGFFAPWWQNGVLRSSVWSIFWPISMLTSLMLTFRTQKKEIKFFFYLLPIIYILLTSNQVPFTRYFIIILPYLYLNLSSKLVTFLRS